LLKRVSIGNKLNTTTRTPEKQFWWNI